MGNFNSSLLTQHMPQSAIVMPDKLVEDEPLSRARFIKSHRCHNENSVFLVKTFVKPPGFVLPEHVRKELSGMNVFLIT